MTEAETVLAATGHTAGEAVQENVVAATCTTGGSYDVVTRCEDSNAILSSYTIAAVANGHTWDAGTVTTAATCTTDGETTYTCTVCGATYTEAIPATGHTAGTAAKENVVAATCTTGGSYDVVTRCEDCNAILSSYTIAVAATGHTWDAGTVTTAATCTADGVTN